MKPSPTSNRAAIRFKRSSASTIYGILAMAAQNHITRKNHATTKRIP